MVWYDFGDCYFQNHFLFYILRSTSVRLTRGFFFFFAPNAKGTGAESVFTLDSFPRGLKHVACQS